MRILLAGAVALSLSACFGGGGEPLASLDRGNRHPTNRPGSGSSTTDRAPLSAHDQAIANLADAVHNVSLAAYASAEAGRAHDKLGAETAAFNLSDAAQLVNQRALEIQSVDGANQQPSGDCGCEGCPSEPVAQDPDVDNAVAVTALAVDAGAQVSDDLNSVQDETSCVQSCGCEGCEDVCTTVPGNVDEGELSGDVQDAADAGDGANDAGDVLTGTITPQ